MVFSRYWAGAKLSEPSLCPSPLPLPTPWGAGLRERWPQSEHNFDTLRILPSPYSISLFSKHCATSRIFFFPRKWNGCLVWKTYSYDSPWSPLTWIYLWMQTHRRRNPQVNTQWHIHWCNHTNRKLLSTASFPAIYLYACFAYFIFVCISSHFYPWLYIEFLFPVVSYFWSISYFYFALLHHFPTHFTLSLCVLCKYK